MIIRDSHNYGWDGRGWSPIPAEKAWKYKRFDYTSGDLDYMGKSEHHRAATDVGSLWYIWKFTWDGTDLTLMEGPLVGNWDNRASLNWA